MAKVTGRPAGMWILGSGSGHVATPAPTCAKCGMADWAHGERRMATDDHTYVSQEASCCVCGYPKRHSIHSPEESVDENKSTGLAEPPHPFTEHRAETVPGGLQFPRCVHCGVLWPCPDAPKGSV